MVCLLKDVQVLLKVRRTLRSVGTSSSNKFVAMKLGVEALRGIQYKLCMMGVPIAGPVYVYGNNMSVIHNTQHLESTLKKK